MIAYETLEAALVELNRLENQDVQKLPGNRDIYRAACVKEFVEARDWARLPPSFHQQIMLF